MGKEKYIIPIFVPHKGCPNDCVFCNQRKITGQSNEYDFDEVKKDIEDHLETIELSSKTTVEIAFYGGSFTGIAIEMQEKFLALANTYVDQFNLDGIRLSTRPDYINHEILKMLKENNVTTIELGVQSLNDKVLTLSNRGHRSESVYKSSKLIKDYHFNLGIQLMPGLPGDTFDTIKYTTQQVIKIQPDFVRIYPTLVIIETALAELYNKGLYDPLTVEEAVDISMYMYEQFVKHDIKVIRIGLQPTKNIMEGKDVIAGPFHSAFRELVISQYIYKLIKQVLDSIDNKTSNSITFEINNKDISLLIGNKKINKKRLSNDFGINKVRLAINNQFSRGTIVIKYNNHKSKIKFI